MGQRPSLSHLIGYPEAVASAQDFAPYGCMEVFAGSFYCCASERFSTWPAPTTRRVKDPLFPSALHASARYGWWVHTQAKHKISHSTQATPSSDRQKEKKRPARASLSKTGRHDAGAARVPKRCTRVPLAGAAAVTASSRARTHARGRWSPAASHAPRAQPRPHCCRR